MTKQGALMLLLGDQHEHLGQSIAYARSNGVVPPWSGRRGAPRGDLAAADAITILRIQRNLATGGQGRQAAGEPGPL